MGNYQIKTSPEEDKQIEKLLELTNEKTVTKLFRKLIKARLEFID